MCVCEQTWEIRGWELSYLRWDGFTLGLEFSHGSNVKEKQMDRLTLSPLEGLQTLALWMRVHVHLKKPLFTKFKESAEESQSCWRWCNKGESGSIRNEMFSFQHHIKLVTITRLLKIQTSLEEYFWRSISGGTSLAEHHLWRMVSSRWRSWEDPLLVLTLAGRCRPSSKFQKQQQKLNGTVFLIKGMSTVPHVSLLLEPDPGQIRELSPEQASHRHCSSIQTAASDLLQLNLLLSIITPVWFYGICAEKKCVSIQLAPSKTNTTCHSGLSWLSEPPYHMLVCSNTLFTFLLANYLLLSAVCLGAGRSVMGESQPFSNWKTFWGLCRGQK